MNGSMYGYVMRRLQETKGKWQLVADGSHVSKRTIEKIARREIEDPGVSHIENLYHYFKSVPAARKRKAATA